MKNQTALNPETNPADAIKPLPWTVMVDDDSHFMDESRREVQGRYATLEEAVRVSMSITARGLPDDDEPRYTSSSEDPFILPVPDAAELTLLLAKHPEWPAGVFADGYYSSYAYAAYLMSRRK